MQCRENGIAPIMASAGETSPDPANQVRLSRAAPLSGQQLDVDQGSKGSNACTVRTVQYYTIPYHRIFDENTFPTTCTI